MTPQLHRIQKTDPGVPKPPVMKLHSLPEINIDSYQKLTTAKGNQKAKMHWQLQILQQYQGKLAPP